MSDRSRTLPVLVGALAVLAVLAPAAIAPASASTPPDRLCPVCGSALERAGEDAGVPIAASDGRLRVAVDRSGTGTFTARVTVNESAADELATDPGARDALLDAAFDAHRVYRSEQARDRSLRVDGDDLVVTYEIPGMATTGPGDVLLVTGFAHTTASVDVNADAFVLTGPEGWVVANRPATGTVQSASSLSDGETANGEGVSWTLDADGYGPYLGQDTYVAFAPEGGLLASVNAELAVATHIGPAMLADALAASWLAALVLAVALAGCLFGLGGSPNPRRASRWLAIASGLVVIGGGLLILLDGYGPLPSRNFQLLALPAGIAAFGMLSTRAPAVANLREAAWRVSGTVGVGGVVAWAFSTSFSRVFVAIVTVAIAGFYLVGVYDQRVGWPVAAVSAAILATPILGILPWTPIGGFGPGFAAIVLTAVSVPTAAVGVVVYRIGAGKRVAGDRVVDQRTTA